MTKIIVNLDGSAIQFSRTQYIRYLKDHIGGHVMPLDCYNAKYLGGIRYMDDLENELETIYARRRVC